MCAVTEGAAQTRQAALNNQLAEGPMRPPPLRGPPPRHGGDGEEK